MLLKLELKYGGITDNFLIDKRKGIALFLKKQEWQLVNQTWSCFFFF